MRRSFVYGLCALALSLVVVLPSAWAGYRHKPSGETGHAASRRGFVFPLKVSKDRRYLVDQHGKPFLIVGDSPQSLIGDLPLKQASFYLADRKKAGFNALWVDLLCTTYTGCPPDARTSTGSRRSSHRTTCRRRIPPISPGSIRSCAWPRTTVSPFFSTRSRPEVGSMS